MSAALWRTIKKVDYSAFIKPSQYVSTVLSDKDETEKIVLVFWSSQYPWGTSLVTQRVKHLPTMQETWVRSQGREDPLEKEVATHSSTLAWKIPWMEEPVGLQSMGSQRVGHD